MKKSERDFNKRTGVAGSSAVNIHGNNIEYGKMPDSPLGNEIIFLSPIDGDMLSEYDGIVSDGCLHL